MPSPFSGRDVLQVQALTRDRVVYILRDLRLFVWDKGALRQLDESESWDLQRGPNDWIYYFSRKLPEGDTARHRWAKDALKRINANLDIETVWESADLQILNWSLDDQDGHVKLVVRRAPRRRTITIPITEDK